MEVQKHKRKQVSFTAIRAALILVVVVLVVGVYCDDGMMIFFVRLGDWTRERNNGDV